jgi:hypothetical protein
LSTRRWCERKRQCREVFDHQPCSATSAGRRRQRQASAALSSECYRFNRRTCPAHWTATSSGAVERATITYDQLKTGTMPGGANRIRRPPAGCATCSAGVNSKTEQIKNCVRLVNTPVANFPVPP